jgi:hypothetical protein
MVRNEAKRNSRTPTKNKNEVSNPQLSQLRLNSMAENYRYKVGVVGSIPTVATKIGS